MFLARAEPRPTERSKGEKPERNDAKRRRFVLCVGSEEDHIHGGTASQTKNNKSCANPDFLCQKVLFFTVTCRAAVALIYTVTVHQITRRAAHVWREMETSKIKKSAPDAELETREACDWLGTRDPCGFDAKVPFFSRKRSSCVRWSGGGPG